jgi:hypothetical protein
MNKFIQTLYDNLKAKELSDGSINLYIRNLKKLGGDFKSFVFLKKPEEVLSKIEGLKPNTRRAYLISIVSSLNSYGDKYKSLANKYYKLMINLDKEIKGTPTSEMNEAQKKNWESWDSILDVYNKLGSELVLKKKITVAEYNKLLEYVVLSLYVLVQPRRNLDYMKMYICFNGDTSDKTKNYIDYKNKEFVFNVYKTANTYNQTKLPIPDSLMKVINMYITYHPLLIGKKKVGCVPFLVNANGEPLNKINSITRILNKIFGKKISSSMLRHIWISNKYGDIQKEREADAKAMGHSITTQQEYIKEL